MPQEKRIIREEEFGEIEEKGFRIYPKKEWTEEDIKKYLQRRAKLLRHTPCKAEINRDKDGPRLKQVLKMFGTYEHAILSSGLELPPRPWAKYSDEELLDVARKWSEEHPGAELSAFHLENHPDLPSRCLIVKRFETVNKYFELAGVPHDPGISPWIGSNPFQ